MVLINTKINIIVYISHLFSWESPSLKRFPPCRSALCYILIVRGTLCPVSKQILGNPSFNMAANQILDTDSEDEMPAGWEERVTVEGKVYYAKSVHLCSYHACT